MSKLQTYRRPILGVLAARLGEDAARIQVLGGPRQVGKTTVVRQALRILDQPSHYASADDPALRDAAWLAAQWEEGRRLARGRRGGAILAVDEIQKVTGWAETVKRLWDEDRAAASTPCQPPSLFPLRLKPGCVPQGGLVGAGVLAGR